MMFYSNLNGEEITNYMSFLGPVGQDSTVTDSLKNAQQVFIDLETYIFQGFPDKDFASHNFDLKELNNRFNSLVKTLNEADPEHKKYRVLFINLIDVKSSTDKQLFWWSYYNHKFAASKGKDLEAMNKWHALENSIGTDKIAEFKFRRENNLAFYLHIIKNHLFFDEILFATINPVVKAETKFGLDIAEELYVRKIIEENNADQICKVVGYLQASPLLYFIKKHLFKDKQLTFKGHIISNSRGLDQTTLVSVREIFSSLSVKESVLNETDFVFLVNDLDLLSSIPYIDTDKPVFAADLSEANSPNFSYLLLKDEGFEQVYSYAKKRNHEKLGDTIIRSLVPGILSLTTETRFVEQIAINYMDDYFAPLAKSFGQSLKEFSGAINLLISKLES